MRLSHEIYDVQHASVMHTRQTWLRQLINTRWSRPTATAVGETDMTWWTLMLITFIDGPFDGEQVPIVYKTEAACLAAISTVSGTLDYDHAIRCAPTDMASGSIRPKARPEDRK